MASRRASAQPSIASPSSPQAGAGVGVPKAGDGPSGRIGDSEADGAGSQPADLAKLKRYFAEACYKTQDARTHSLSALDYYDSDQFTRDELTRLAARGQPAITINRIKPAVNGIVGVVERGRSDPK
ncbi:MAG: hypothetical protein ACREEX_07135, partial [Caulobacteraceae bacterium]